MVCGRQNGSQQCFINFASVASAPPAIQLYTYTENVSKDVLDKQTDRSIYCWIEYKTDEETTLKQRNHWSPVLVRDDQQCNKCKYIWKWQTMLQECRELIMIGFKSWERDREAGYAGSLLSTLRHGISWSSSWNMCIAHLHQLLDAGVSRLNLELGREGDSEPPLFEVLLIPLTLRYGISCSTWNMQLHCHPL